jgi:hypothetical protein
MSESPREAGDDLEAVCKCGGEIKVSLWSGDSGPSVVRLYCVKCGDRYSFLFRGRGGDDEDPPSAEDYATIDAGQAIHGQTMQSFRDLYAKAQR